VFVVLKVVKLLIMPPALVAWLLAGALGALLRHRRRPALLMLAAALGLYWGLSADPIAYLLVRSLEAEIPPAGELRAGSVDAIVVLAASAARAGGSRPRPELSGTAWKRFWRGLELYRELEGSAPLLYSGGSGDIFRSEPVEGSLARSYAVAMGIPAAAVILEERSRNTDENARETEGLLRRMVPSGRPRVALVTSSIHMPRALLALEERGIDAVPVPADYPFGEYRFTPLGLVPRAETFFLSSRCLHEWLGIAWHRFRAALGVVGSGG